MGNQVPDAGQSAYTTAQVSQWLQRLALPPSLRQYATHPSAFPHTLQSLRTLMRCQIAAFTYENLSVHYSPSHRVDITPEALYQKLLGPHHRHRGGYCMELSIFFYHMLLGLGFNVYMTGVRNRTRTAGIPQGEYQGWTHIINIVQLPDQSRHALDVAFGGDGPTTPLPLNDEGTAFTNLGAQQIRLVHDLIPKQRMASLPRLWIYQYRNGVDRDWNSFYSFAELEFFQEDFEVMNWWAVEKTVHRRNVIAVRFLRKGDGALFAAAKGTKEEEGSEPEIIGKVMLVNDVIKVNLGGRTEVVRHFQTEEGRVLALDDYFGIRLTEEERRGIDGWDMSLDRE
ncbi:hypothetical protein NLU13_9080 [Sarocladium strictum]|uniref:Arylamine N-acetyltransferase n=1 Tax=Sarocladium strictum TaxID=5046 RepID=A0AA39G9G7_SARSR|nr:hypothetical protein NLU13_9080 [Sarocladium strictum]